jgi:hypothetical protein
VNHREHERVPIEKDGWITFLLQLKNITHKLLPTLKFRLHYLVGSSEYSCKYFIVSDHVNR